MIRYLITDPAYYSQKPKTLCKLLSLNVKNYSPTFACLRDKTTKNYTNLAKAFVQQCSNLHIESFLHVNYELAYKLKAYGVHIPMSYCEYIPKAKKKGLFTITSTHTLKEALYAEKLGANAITFSPIFSTPNKGTPVGLEKLKEIIDKINIDCYALGGIITDEHVRQCLQTGVAGFASIRYFLTKR